MSVTPHTAAEVMDRSAALLNDPAKTDFTYAAQLPYLNMAIAELNEHLEEANIPITDQSLYQVFISPGRNALDNPPLDAVEYQEIAERPSMSGNTAPWTYSTDAFRVLPRREFSEIYPITDSLVFWCLEDNKIKFNEVGASVPIQLRIRYIRRVIPVVYNPEEPIKKLNATTYLSFKTAALCAMFIGENQERATVLNQEANNSLERIIGISNKGRQEIMTRHRPFRAGYKLRGY
jgi:hypothetical protein